LVELAARIVPNGGLNTSRKEVEEIGRLMSAVEFGADLVIVFPPLAILFVPEVLIGFGYRSWIVDYLVP